MQELELSNAEDLDLEYSNFRLFGIGKPSPNQIARWERKGKVNKLNRLLSKGKLSPNQLSESGKAIVDPTYLGGEIPMSDETVFDEAGNAIQTAQSVISGSPYPQNQNVPSQAGVMPNSGYVDMGDFEDDTVMGMPKNAAIGIGAFILLASIGFAMMMSRKGATTPVASHTA